MTMLREIRHIRQIAGEPLRRWFSDADFDLIVWFERLEIVGFQLCYGKQDQEQALSWQRHSGYCHSQVDNGEPSPGRHKAAPILIPGGHFDAGLVASMFLRRSQSIEQQIARFVYDKLLGYPQYKACG